MSKLEIQARLERTRLLVRESKKLSRRSQSSITASKRLAESLAARALYSRRLLDRRALLPLESEDPTS